MTYYTQKRKAYRTIDGMLKRKATIAQIKLTIAKTFGFSEKMVDRYLKLNEEAGKGK